MSNFATFKESTKVTFDKCFSVDHKLWKLNRFIKDKDDFKTTELVLNENYDKLVGLFDFVRALGHGDISSLDSSEFRSWCTKVGLIDPIV